MHKQAVHAVNHQPLLHFLQQDTLRHIVHLKMLALYGEAMTCHFLQQGEEKGCVLLLPTAVSDYDQRTYPDSQFVVLAAATHPDLLHTLALRVPTDQPLIFKLISPEQAEVFSHYFALQRLTAFISYTDQPQAVVSMPAGVVVSKGVVPDLLPLFAANGYSAEVVTGYFAKGQAVSFAVYGDGGGDGGETAVCACLAYHNYNNIWEIGALHTLPTARRQGHAQKVVAAAVHHLQINQLRPRYQFHESNHASQQLAKKLGLIPFLTTTQFACQPIIM